MPVNIMVREFKELGSFKNPPRYLDNIFSLFCLVRYIAFDICNNRITNNENSITLIMGLMLSKTATIWLNISLPKNKVILFPKWNNKNIHKKIPDIAI